MPTRKLAPIHPVAVLLADHPEPLGLSQGFAADAPSGASCCAPAVSVA